MRLQIHELNDLFAQLGLPSTDQDMETFIARNHLDHQQKLHEATFWSKAQAELIRQLWLEDADWCGAVDILDTRLRH